MDLFAARCPWYVAGPLVGLSVVGLLAATNRTLGALGGFIELGGWLRRPGAGPGWRVFFLVGMVLGGVLFALASGGWTVSLAYGTFDRTLGATTTSKVLLLVLAGALMGFGARMAGGCTSGHGVCGTALGSRASLVATVTFMATAIAATAMLRWLTGGV